MKQVEERIRDPQTDVLLVHGPHGASSVVSKAFSQLTPEFHTVWIELREDFDEADFSFLILESLAREAGVAAPFPIDRNTLKGKVEEPRTVQLSQLTRNAARAADCLSQCQDFPPCETAWKNDCYEPLARIVSWLGSNPDLAVVIVSWDPFYERLRKDLDAVGAPQVEGLKLCPLPQLRDDESIVKSVVGTMEADADARFVRFALGLTLFRYPCYLSALHAWALLPARAELACGVDSDDERFSAAERFLSSLRKCEVIRDDSGNNVFMYRAYRDAIRSKVREANLVGDESATSLALAEGHQGIADWYVKLYRSSGDLHAAFESIYHRIQCLKQFKAGALGRLSRDREPAEAGGRSASAKMRSKPLRAASQQRSMLFLASSRTCALSARFA